MNFYWNAIYDVFFFRAVAISRNWIKVIVNSTNGQTAYIKRFEANFVNWPEFLATVHSVERTDPETNPVRLKPLDHAAVIANAADIPLKVIAAEGDWLMVSADGPGNGIPSHGFIRWRKCDVFLVRYFLFS